MGEPLNVPPDSLRHGQWDNACATVDEAATGFVQAASRQTYLNSFYKEVET